MTKHLTEDERSHLIAQLFLLEHMVTRFPIDRHSGPYLQELQNQAVKAMLREIRSIKELLSK
jgi:hypothetical protein